MLTQPMAGGIIESCDPGGRCKGILEARIAKATGERCKDLIKLVMAKLDKQRRHRRPKIGSSHWGDACN